MILPAGRNVVMADTSAVLAGYHQADPDHKAARDVLDAAPTLIMSPLVLAELDHLGRERMGYRAAMSMLDELQQKMAQGRLVVPELTSLDIERAQKIRKHYADLMLDLADATTVVLSATWQTTYVFTLDKRDFLALRPLGPHNSHFTLLPVGIRARTPSTQRQPRRPRRPRR
ncbi:PIN domain-containing protein [Streptomyces sp. S1]|uniref:PIN domain-containing protein n=1 Tax=Streptomyces sp. S1 TaxID=718288 RepID=UPI003D70D6C2